MILASVFLLSERKSHGQIDWKCSLTFHSIVAALRSPKLYLVALFLFLYSFAPGFGTPLYYFMTDELKFSQSYIGVLGSIASAGWIVGALVHRWLLRRMSSKALLYLSIVLGTLSAASFLLLTDEVTAAIVNFANGAAMMIATIASLTLAADYCPRRSEGFAFAGLMSIMNLADVFSNNIGAFLYEHVFDSRLGPLIIVSAATTALAAVLVPLLRLGLQATSLFRLDPGGLQHRAPDAGLHRRPVGELLRRAAHGDEAALAQILAHLRRRHGGVQRLVELGDGGGRRAGRRDQRVDDGAVDVAEALLLEGLDVGRRRPRARAPPCRRP